MEEQHKLANNMAPLMQESLQESEYRFQSLMDCIPGVSIQGCGLDGIIRYWNKASESLFGYTAEEALGRNIADLIIPPDLMPIYKECFEAGARATTSGEIFPPREVQLLDKNGAMKTVYCRHAVVVIEGKEPIVFCIEVNITEHFESARLIHESDFIYRALFESANDAIVLIDSNTVMDCNQQALNMFGCEREQFVGQSLDKFLPHCQFDGRATGEILQEKVDLVIKGQPQVFEINLTRYDGTTFEAEVSLNSVCIQEKGILQAIARDITERKKIEKWLRYRSMHDQLTGLYNRNYFEEELLRMETGRFNPVGIVICDLDGLKLVNDNLGHDVGDALLSTAAQLLLKCFRDSDVVARIGGDEFAVILPNCPPQMVETACDRIRGITAEYQASSPPLPLSISVGWAVKKDSAKSMQDIFKEADSHMYNEKPKNRERFWPLFEKMLINSKQQ